MRPCSSPPSDELPAEENAEEVLEMDVVRSCIFGRFTMRSACMGAGASMCLGRMALTGVLEGGGGREALVQIIVAWVEIIGRDNWEGSWRLKISTRQELEEEYDLTD
jgi:hypothetical protein